MSAASVLPSTASLALLAFGAARSVPLVWAIPAFGGPTLPAQVRVALGVGLAWLSFPLLASAQLPGQPLAWVVLGVREVLVGAVMGFVCACTFRAAEAAGMLADQARGLGGHSLSVAGSTATSPLGVLLALLVCVVFFEIGGVGHTATALARSYEAIPLGGSLRVGLETDAAARLAIVASGRLIEAALGLAAPVLVALLLTDVVVGLLGRAVPWLSADLIVVPAKPLLGLGAVLVALAGMRLALEGRLREFFALLGSALRWPL